MQKHIAFFFMLFVCIATFKKAVAVESVFNSHAYFLESTTAIDSTNYTTEEINRVLSTHPLLLDFVKAHAENKKLVALVLTATLGMLGVHRLYLGTKPWIPAIYLFTFGGCFFILPFIDFVVLLISKDISRFENNNKVFMWAN